MESCQEKLAVAKQYLGGDKEAAEYGPIRHGHVEITESRTGVKAGKG
jgi:hypothetical protein